MKRSPLALALTPVLAGGIAVVAAVSVLDTAETPTPEPTPVLGRSVGDQAARADAAGAVSSTGSRDDTEIDGRRPHLTVIDGRPVVVPLGAIPAALSLLPPPSIDLPPLSDLGGDLAWPTDGGDRHGRTTRGTTGDDRTDDSTSTDADPRSPTSRKPADPSSLSAVPNAPSQNDDRDVAGSVSRPPAPGRPSDAISSPLPPDEVGPPGDEGIGRPPPTVYPEPLTPSTKPLIPAPEPLAPGPESVVPGPEAVVPDGGRGHVGGDQPDEVPEPAVEADLDDSQPPVR